MDSEDWRPVIGWEGYYEVSRYGEVRSVDRFILRSSGVTAFYAGRTLSPHRRNSGGYRVACLNRHGRASHYTVHSLVAAAFIGPRPTGLDIRHLDGDKLNNNADNLAYGTVSENMIDKLAHGTHPIFTIEKCCRGHKLSGDNIYRGGKYNLARNCRSCKNARKVNARHGMTLSDHELQRVSDQYYEGYQRGGLQPLRKIEDADVIELREMFAAGHSKRELADKFGISTGTVRAIAYGHRHKRVPGPISKGRQQSTKQNAN